MDNPSFFFASLIDRSSNCCNNYSLIHSNAFSSIQTRLHFSFSLVFILCLIHWFHNSLHSIFNQSLLQLLAPNQMLAIFNRFWSYEMDFGLFNIWFMKLINTFSSHYSGNWNYWLAQSTTINKCVIKMNRQ